MTSWSSPPLAFALAAMQVPAVAHGYTAALLQIAEDARRDIEQRKAAARQHYRGAGTSERGYRSGNDQWMCIDRRAGFVLDHIRFE